MAEAQSSVPPEFATTTPMAIRIFDTVEDQLLVGKPTVVESESRDGKCAAVFEDDGDTGYFYAVDPLAGEQPIQDAVHVYDARGVADREKPSVVTIGWSENGRAAVLLINGYPHAVFDFKARQAYCRSGFPQPLPDAKWSAQGNGWVESCLDLFA